MRVLIHSMPILLQLDERRARLVARKAHLAAHEHGGVSIVADCHRLARRAMRDRISAAIVLIASRPLY